MNSKKEKYVGADPVYSYFKGKTQKGITLIALVITIIVLLILAGVTINMVLGDDGIIQNAQQASMQEEKSSDLENIGTAVLTEDADVLANGGERSYDDIQKTLVIRL